MTITHSRTITRVFASLTLAVLVSSFALFGLIARVNAVAPPNILTYQGRLLNTNGVPVSDATLSISFALYDAASAGTCLWSNNSGTCASVAARTVTLTDGLFSENLGDTAAATPYAAIADSVFADNASVYLEVIVSGETLTPRKRVVAAPYALNASTLDGFNSTQVGGTSALALVLDSSGNLQLTGSPQGSAVGQGALYVNPATGVVAADETLFGVAVNGTSRFRIDGEGDTALLGDFVVGGTTLTAPFSVDESLNTVRIGDGTSDTNNPTITFYASDAADSGSIAYTDADLFEFSGGNVAHVGLGTLPTVASQTAIDFSTANTFTGTSGNTLSTLNLYAFGADTSYSAVEGTDTDHYTAGGKGTLTLTGSSTTLTRGYGFLGRLSNTSTNASLVGAGGYLTGLEAEFTHGAAATTLAEAYGVHGFINASTGTLSSATGVYGEVTTSAGTITTSYAGRFQNTTAGATRYGIYALASGGATANYAGYFGSASVQIDDDTTPNAATAASGAGDLYVVNELEVDGSTYLGDGGAGDILSFSSGATTIVAVDFSFLGLTSGSGMVMSRPDSAADFDGTLVSIAQNNNNATSDAKALQITNLGLGNSIGLYLTQDTVDDRSAGTTTGNQAVVIDVNEAVGGGADDVILVRSDADGTPDVEWVVELDGETRADGAYTGTGVDFAEFFATADMTLGDNEVVCRDALIAHSVKKCEAGNHAVVGITSTSAAFIASPVPAAGINLSENPNFALVGMVGQVDTKVTAADGAITVGDAISSSSTLAGYGAKAHGPVQIIGFALQSLASGTGTIKVLVQPQWYGGDVLTSDGSATVTSADVVFAPMRTATASASGNSHDLVLRGSGWNGAAAVSKQMTLRNDVTDGSATYRLSVVNDAGAQVASVGDTGDLAIAGRLFPSDRGVLQASKYIYYDGADGAGGDFMRTNASGWGSGSYDFAEMFPSTDLLAAGEVVVFADAKESIGRSTGRTYDDRIAGVVSTRPGFLAGDNAPGNVPVALAGRVPTYVSGENGAIAVGDPLTSSSKAGYAMKATEPGPIVGYAMASFSGGTGVIVAFVRPSYFDGNAVDAPIAENTVSSVGSVATLDVSGSMNMNGGSIISVASLMGIGNNWRLLESGDFVTRGTVVGLIRSFAGEDVETYAAFGRERTIQLSGTAMLMKGTAKIDFEKLDQAFNDVISTEAPYRVIVTPAGTTGNVYVSERSNAGFTIRDASNTTGVAVDWLVIAYHKDFAPEVIIEDAIAEETVVESSHIIEIPSDEVADEQEADEPIVEEIVAPEEESALEPLFEPVAEEPIVVEDAIAPEDGVSEQITTDPETPSL